KDQQWNERGGRKVTGEGDKRLKKCFDRLIRAHRDTQRHADDRGDDEAPDDSPDGNSDVSEKAVRVKQAPTFAQHRHWVGKEGLGNEAAKRRHAPYAEEHPKEQRSKNDAPPGRYRFERSHCDLVVLAQAETHVTPRRPGAGRDPICVSDNNQNRSLDPGPRYAPRDDTAVSSRGEAKASCSWTAVSLDELCIYDRVEIRLCLDESNFQEKIRRFLAESLDLAIEETLVRFSILPSQVRCRIGELLCALFDVGTHDLVALLRFFLDHIDRVEVACHHFLDRPGIFLDEFGRATKGVHDHRIVERGGDDLSYRRILAHFG